MARITPAPQTPVPSMGAQGDYDTTNKAAAFGYHVSLMPDVKPILTGFDLGKYAIKNPKHAFSMLRRQPAAFLHALSGKWTKMQDNDPVKYLRELSALCEEPSQSLILFDQANRISSSTQNAQVKENAEGAKKFALARYALDTSGKFQDPAGFYQQLRQITEMCKKLDSPAEKHSTLANNLTSVCQTARTCCQIENALAEQTLPQIRVIQQHVEQRRDKPIDGIIEKLEFFKGLSKN